MTKKARHLDIATIPMWCDGCEQQGEIYVNSPEESVFVICENCGYETADVWCPKCGMGGEYIRNVEDRPKSWACPKCRTRYRLPVDFYEHPVSLIITQPKKAAIPKSAQGDAWVLLLAGAVFLSIGLFIIFGTGSFIGKALAISGFLFFALALRAIRVI